MAKKKTKGKNAEREAGPGFRCEVMLKAVSVGGTTAAIGFEAKREELKLDLADKVLVDARLNVKLEVDADQEELFEGALPKIESVADCNRMSVGVGTIGGRLTFRRQDVDLETLSAFATKNATLTVTRVGYAGGIDPEKKDESADEAPAE